MQTDYAAGQFRKRNKQQQVNNERGTELGKWHPISKVMVNETKSRRPQCPIAYNTGDSHVNNLCAIAAGHGEITYNEVKAVACFSSPTYT